MTLDNSVVSGNRAGFGGGILNDGVSGSATATLNKSAVSNNSVKFDGLISGGGGIYNNGDSGVATLTLTGSTVSGNVAGTLVVDPFEEHPFEPGSGGGIYNDGTGSVRSGNAQLILANTTVSGNIVHADISDGGKGAGIYGDGSLGSAATTVNNSNINENSGGGAYNFAESGDAMFTMADSRVTGNIGDGLTNFGFSSAEGPGNATMSLTDTVVNGNVGAGINSGGSLRVILTIVHCDLSDNRGAAISNGNGSAMITDSTILRNHDSGIFNGALDAFSTMTISNSTIRENYARGLGGGIHNEANLGNISGNAILKIDKTTISDNHALSGGGIANFASGGTATATITNSTLSGNSADGDPLPDPDGDLYAHNFAPGGGGVFNGGFAGLPTVNITNCTISGNSTKYSGGGIKEDLIAYPVNGRAGVSLDNCTLSGNSAENDGASIWTDVEIKPFDEPPPPPPPGAPPPPPTKVTVDFANTIFKPGALGGNVQNTIITSHGYNLSSDAAGGDGSTGPGGFLNAIGDLRNLSPRLGPLQDNGGPTMTHALLLGSLAIDAGDPSFDPNSFTPPLLFDQRSLPGFPRVVNGRIDIGAFESRHP